ncbi:MAG: hypothetical protein GXP43_03415 [bacterium]|nr:hypothetical protein [bacterium]
MMTEKLLPGSQQDDELGDLGLCTRINAFMTGWSKLIERIEMGKEANKQWFEGLSGYLFLKKREADLSVKLYRTLMSDFCSWYVAVMDGCLDGDWSVEVLRGRLTGVVVENSAVGLAFYAKSYRGAGDHVIQIGDLYKIVRSKRHRSQVPSIRVLRVGWEAWGRNDMYKMAPMIELYNWHPRIKGSQPVLFKQKRLPPISISQQDEQGGQRRQKELTRGEVLAATGGFLQMTGCPEEVYAELDRWIGGG